MSGLRTWSVRVAGVSAVVGIVCIGSAFLGDRVIGIEPLFGKQTWSIGKAAFVITTGALWIHKRSPEEPVEPMPTAERRPPFWRRMFSLSEIPSSNSLGGRSVRTKLSERKSPKRHA